MEAWDSDHILVVNGIFLLGILSHCKEIKRLFKCIHNLRKGDKSVLVASVCALHHCAFCRAVFLGDPGLGGVEGSLDLFVMICLFKENIENSFCFFKALCFSVLIVNEKI